MCTRGCVACLEEDKNKKGNSLIWRFLFSLQYIDFIYNIHNTTLQAWRHFACTRKKFKFCVPDTVNSNSIIVRRKIYIMFSMWFKNISKKNRELFYVLLGPHSLVNLKCFLQTSHKCCTIQPSIFFID